MITEVGCDALSSASSHLARVVMTAEVSKDVNRNGRTFPCDHSYRIQVLEVEEALGVSSLMTCLTFTIRLLVSFHL